MPLRDYSTHLPAVFETDKLRQTIADFDAFNRPRLIESIYLNQWTDEGQAVGLGEFLQYRRRPGDEFTINPRSTVLNVGQFTEPVRDALDQLLCRKPVDPARIRAESTAPCMHRSAHSVDRVEIDL